MHFRKPEIFQILHIVLFGLACIYASFNQFIQDDAFISFRYANNFANGHGLVFNIGEHVEGYSNFLWTILIGNLQILGYSPESLILFIGLIGLGITHLLFVKLLSSQNISPESILLATAILFFNFSFSSYCTGGLETQLQTILFLMTVLLTQKALSKGKNQVWIAFLLSIVFGLLILNRLDSALLISVVGLFVLIQFIKDDIHFQKKAIIISALIVPSLIIIGYWLQWKYEYYGDFLPNTYYIKVRGTNSAFQTLLRGFAYVGLFGFVYFLLPNLLLISKLKPIYLYFRNFKAKLSLTSLAVIIIGLYNMYFIYIGGDFMEFRFQVPLLPLYILLLVTFADQFISIRIYASLFIISSLLYSVSFKGAISGFESIPFLQKHINSPSSDWKGIGQKLKFYFGESNARIAVSPAGAIPYFSELYTLDLLGLNDKWVAKNGLAYKNTPGHYKIAPLKYIQEQNIHLVIGHPLLIKNTELVSTRSSLGLKTLIRILPKTEFKLLQGNKWKIIEVPINADYTLLCWYLTPSSLVDKVIDEHSLFVSEIEL